MTTKEQVLAILLDSPDIAISGEVLAKKTGVSRNSVWKAVNVLREEGHEIEAVTNRGYRLLDNREPVSEAGIRKWLKTQRFGQRMEVESVMDSTNARAKILARRGAPEGTLVVARGQTHGCGRKGRSFFSPADSGVYLSFILRPQMPAERAVLLTAMCAVAASRAIESLAHVDAGIKWVNDIYLNGKKAAGILCEAELEMETGMLAYVVAGIGINVSPMVFPEELKDIADSIGNVCGHDISKNRLIAEICGAMEQLTESGDFMNEYCRRSVVIGRKVHVDHGDSSYSAVVDSIDMNGRLILKTEFGTRMINSGEIRLTGGKDDEQ